MNVYGILFTLFLMGPGLFAQNNESARAEPYWRSQKQIFAKIKQNRHIEVSTSKVGQSWSFKGAGLVNAPLDRCFRAAQDYERLARITKYFSHVSFKADESRLYLRVHILWLSRDLVVKIRSYDEGPIKRQEFQILQGTLTGLKGEIIFEDFERYQSLVSIEAHYTGDVFLPSWMFTLATEGLMQHVARGLRDMLESEQQNIGR